MDNGDSRASRYCIQELRSRIAFTVRSMMIIGTI